MRLLKGLCWLDSLGTALPMVLGPAPPAPEFTREVTHTSLLPHLCSSNKPSLVQRKIQMFAYLAGRLALLLGPAQGTSLLWSRRGQGWNKGGAVLPESAQGASVGQSPSKASSLSWVLGPLFFFIFQDGQKHTAPR